MILKSNLHTSLHLEFSSVKWWEVPLLPWKHLSKGRRKATSRREESDWGRDAMSGRMALETFWILWRISLYIARALGNMGHTTPCLVHRFKRLHNSLVIPLVRCSTGTGTSLETLILWKRLRRGYIPDHYNLSVCKPIVNRHHSQI